MRKIILTLAVSLAFCSIINAGPETYSGKEMKQAIVPPPAPSCFNWAGFYAGAFGGYKFSNVDVDLRVDGAWRDSGPEAPDKLDSEGSRNLDNDGAEAGGLLGYNWQFGCWVVGLEASGGYLWARDSNDTEVFTPALGFDDFRISTSFKTHYLVTVAPRIGYALGRWLPYVTGGLAVGDLDFFQEMHDVLAPPLGERGHTTQTNAGWMIGGGLQYALTDHWSVRAQYQYIDLGDVGFRSEFDGQPAFFAHHEASLTEHNASLAVVFKF